MAGPSRNQPTNTAVAEPFATTNQEILTVGDIKAYKSCPNPRVLGRGSEGIVFEQTHPSTGTLFAVKYSQPPSPNDVPPREVIIMLRLGTSDRVVRLLGFRHKRTTYVNLVFLEHCDGGNLANYKGIGAPDREAGYPASEVFVWHCFKQMAEGLAFLHHGLQPMDLSTVTHKKGYVHRDVKGSNVLLKTPRNPEQLFPDLKLADFGFAIEAGTPPTFQGGTMGYQPFPVLNAPSDDVYALGVVIHTLVHGVEPVVVAYEIMSESVPNLWNYPDQWFRLLQTPRAIDRRLNVVPRNPKALPWKNFFLPNYSERLNYWMMRCLRSVAVAGRPVRDTREIRPSTIELFDHMRQDADRAIAPFSHQSFRVMDAERKDVDDLYKMYLPDAGTTGRGPYSALGGDDDDSDEGDDDDNGDGGNEGSRAKPKPRTKKPSRGDDDVENEEIDIREDEDDFGMPIGKTKPQNQKRARRDDDDDEDLYTFKRYRRAENQQPAQSPPRQNKQSSENRASAHHAEGASHGRPRSGKRPRSRAEDNDLRPSKRQRGGVTSLSPGTIRRREETQEQTRANQADGVEQPQFEDQPDFGDEPEGRDQREREDQTADASSADNVSEDRPRGRKRTSSEIEPDAEPERPTKKPRKGTRGKKGCKGKGKGAATQPRRARAAPRAAPATTRLLAGIDQNNEVAEADRTVVEGRALRKRGSDKKVVKKEK